jgi:hypothetical protein
LTQLQFEIGVGRSSGRAASKSWLENLLMSHLRGSLPCGTTLKVTLSMMLGKATMETRRETTAKWCYVVLIEKVMPV